MHSTHQGCYVGRVDAQCTGIRVRQQTAILRVASMNVFTTNIVLIYFSYAECNSSCTRRPELREHGFLLVCTRAGLNVVAASNTFGRLRLLAILVVRGLWCTRLHYVAEEEHQKSGDGISASLTRRTRFLVKQLVHYTRTTVNTRNRLQQCMRFDIEQCVIEQSKYQQPSAHTRIDYC